MTSPGIADTKYYPHSIVQYLVLLFSAVILNCPFFFLLGNPRLGFQRDVQATIMYILFFITFFLIIYIVNRRRNKKIVLNFRLDDISLLPVLAGLVVCVQTGINLPLLELLRPLTGHGIPSNPLNKIVFFAGAIILAPFFEEILFRGIILRQFLSAYSPAKAIWLSAIIFGLAHGNPSQILLGTELGLLLGWVFYKTRSLGWTMIIHFSANLSSFTGALLRNKLGSIALNHSVFTMYGLYTGYFLAICWALSAVLLYRLYKKLPADTEAGAGADLTE